MYVPAPLILDFAGPAVAAPKLKARHDPPYVSIRLGGFFFLVVTRSQLEGCVPSALPWS